MYLSILCICIFFQTGYKFSSYNLLVPIKKYLIISMHHKIFINYLVFDNGNNNHKN